jgi:hypothetical protein
MHNYIQIKDLKTINLEMVPLKKIWQYGSRLYQMPENLILCGSRTVALPEAKRLSQERIFEIPMNPTGEFEIVVRKTPTNVKVTLPDSMQRIYILRVRVDVPVLRCLSTTTNGHKTSIHYSPDHLKTGTVALELSP